MKAGSIGGQKTAGNCPKPMSYSDSVKQACLRGISEKEGPMSPVMKSKEQLKTIENLKKERENLKKTLDIIKGDYNKLRVNYEEMVARKREDVNKKVASINSCLSTDIFGKDESVCQEMADYQRICELNENISKKVICAKEYTANLESEYVVMRERNEREKELINLSTVDWGVADRRVGRRKLEAICNDKEARLKELEKEVENARKQLEESGQTKQEDFMKKRIQMLKEQVESRVADVQKINEKLQEVEKYYEEKCVCLENLKGMSRELRRELSEPILNRRQFNLCVKENFGYDQRLREVLDERERVQYEYGAVMEDMKKKRELYDAEEKAKEKLFMAIMAQIDEGHQYQTECWNIHARINQMHSEIFVRHGFMHAKENAILDLTQKCNELEKEVMNANREENLLKEEASDLDRKLTEILFDICFAISWDAAGKEISDTNAVDVLTIGDAVNYDDYVDCDDDFSKTHALDRLESNQE